MKTKNLCGILMLFSFLVSCTEQQCIIHGITTGVKDGDYMYMYLQTVVTQCFVNNKSEIWS